MWTSKRQSGASCEMQVHLSRWIWGLRCSQKHHGTGGCIVQGWSGLPTAARTTMKDAIASFSADLFDKNVARSILQDAVASFKFDQGPKMQPGVLRTVQLHLSWQIWPPKRKAGAYWKMWLHLSELIWAFKRQSQKHHERCSCIFQGRSERKKMQPRTFSKMHLHPSVEPQNVTRSI